MYVENVFLRGCFCHYMFICIFGSYVNDMFSTKVCLVKIREAKTYYGRPRGHTESLVRNR